MACEVCEHCHGPASRHEAVVVREGFSYHEKCHKCYVCSETNLHDCEVFKGVIFCSSCAQRIFQGCSTARQTKNAIKPKKNRSRNKRHERSRTRGRRRAEKPKLLRESGVIELARMAARSNRSTDTDSSNQCKTLTKSSKTLASADLFQNAGYNTYDNNLDHVKRESAEIGITTEFTQQLLRQMNCPVVERNLISLPCTISRDASPAKSTKQEQHRGDDKRSKPICSDLRIAELGISTEIATMGLRKKSELLIYLSSEPRLQETRSSLTVLSDVSGEGLGDWLDSAYSSLRRSEQRRLLDRPFRSIMKIPFTYFKYNILNRSSLISVLVSSQNCTHCSLLEKLKLLFHEEVTEHHRRGIKRLYSTINRRKRPYKLGWLHLATMCTGSRPRISDQIDHKDCPCRCKHFKRSHSYRCLRAQVMRLAGPTKSQLAMYRSKIKNALAPSVLTNLLVFTDTRANSGNTYRRCAAIMMSEGCGRSDLESKDGIRS